MPRKSTKLGDKSVKRTIKFLAICKNPSIARSIVQKAPRPVIGAIANASVNAYKGDVSIPPKYKKSFARHRKLFNKLVARNIPIESKRRLIINQKGGSFVGLLAPLLGTVLGSVGSLFLSRNNTTNNG